MRPTVLKPRKSYREQYLSRMELQGTQQNSFMERRQSTPQGIKKTLIPILKSSTDRRIQKTAKKAELQVKEAAKQEEAEVGSNQCQIASSSDSTQQDNFSELGENEGRNIDVMMIKDDNYDMEMKQCAPDNANLQQNISRNTRNSSDSQATSSNLYREMISKYAKALNLNEFERECLGFNETGREMENHRNHRRRVSSNCKSKFAEEQGEPDQHSSTWANLYDQLSLKNWFPFSVTDSSNNNVDNNNNSANNDVPIWDDKASERATPQKIICDSAYHCDLITSGILSLIDKVCKGDHSDGPRNCFKCQYKESFRSFTMYYLNELECICRSKELSLQQQDECFNETLEIWVYQLSEQNMSLADAYNESVQASEKLKRVLLQSRNSMRELQKENDKNKACIDGLNYELSLRDKTIKKLKYEHEIVLEQMRAMEDSLQDTQADVDSLTELILRLRDKGVWDINGLPMGDATFNKIFNGNYYLHGAKVIGHKEFSSKKREWRNEIEMLKSETETLKTIIAAKDKEIQRCRKGDSSSCRFGK